MLIALYSLADTYCAVASSSRMWQAEAQMPFRHDGNDHLTNPDT